MGAQHTPDCIAREATRSLIGAGNHSCYLAETAPGVFEDRDRNGPMAARSNDPEPDPELSFLRRLLEGRPN